MHGLLIYGILSLGTWGDGKAATSDTGPTWMKDYAQARAKALREDKPIFVVFR
jgi:hypothetical protein